MCSVLLARGPTTQSFVKDWGSKGSMGVLEEALGAAPRFAAAVLVGLGPTGGSFLSRTIPDVQEQAPA